MKRGTSLRWMNAKITLLSKKITTDKADALVVVVQGPAKENALVQAIDGAVGGGLLKHLERVDFDPEKGGVVCVPLLHQTPVSQVVLSGVRNENGGDGATFGEAARISAAVASGVRACLARRPTKINVAIDESLSLRAVAQGVGLGVYKFDKYFTSAK